MEYISKTKAIQISSKRNLDLWLSENLIRTSSKRDRTTYCRLDIEEQLILLESKEKEKSSFIGPLPFVSKKKGKPKVHVTDFQTIKVPLKGILRDVKVDGIPIIDKINNIVINCNKIFIHSLQFLKLYFIHLYDKNQEFPTIDKKFVVILFQLCCGKNVEPKYADVANFYKRHYSPIQGEEFECVNLDHIMDYMAIGIVTDINNNIYMRFTDYVLRYVNVMFHKKASLEYIKQHFKTEKERNHEKYSILNRLKKIKNALLSSNHVPTPQELGSIEDQEAWILEERSKIYQNTDFYKGVLKYDLEKYPQKYLRGMFYMMRQIEEIKDEQGKSCEKLLNLFPLRSDIIPKYIKFDTTSVVKLLLSSKKEQFLNNQKQKSYYMLHIMDCNREIWNHVFKIEKKVFNIDCKGKHKYTFHFMIETDGVGASIILRKKGEIKQKGEINEIETNEIETNEIETNEIETNEIETNEIETNEIETNKIGTNKIETNEIETNEIETNKSFHKPKFKELYTDECVLPRSSKTGNIKKVVGIDPNKSDLIFCSDESNNTFRYTQNQKRKETKMKKYRNILKKNKTSTKVPFPMKITDHVHITVTTVVPQTITEIEASLSHFNKKTLNFGAFKEYIKNKSIVNNALNEFYQNKLYRKQKLSSFVLRQKSEQKMINHFQEKYGNPDEVVIGFGDYEQKGHMKYKEPVKGKGFRNLFRKAGYEVLLVDEYRTSCRCSHCESDVGICETFRFRENPKPWKEGQIKVHGLVKCKTCSRLWNRDVNASRNIFKIAYNEIRGIERPSYLKRSNQVPINEDIAPPVLLETMNIVKSTNKVTLKRRKTVVKKT